jgi:hypothetical protein
VTGHVRTGTDALRRIVDLAGDPVRVARDIPIPARS